MSLLAGDKEFDLLPFFFNNVCIKTNIVSFIILQIYYELDEEQEKMNCQDVATFVEWNSFAHSPVT